MNNKQAALIAAATLHSGGSVITTRAVIETAYDLEHYLDDRDRGVALEQIPGMREPSA